ncbi:MAG: hypothetical protein IPN42_08010 [Methylococcaceae bacterium]|nr:hypothetical protein [Methylococcaceae bacterium]
MVVNKVKASFNKPDCILHIGMHKTGSSSIQSTLCKLPATAEFEYLSFAPTGNNSGFISSLFWEFPEQYHGNVKQGLTSEQVKEKNKKNKDKFELALKQTRSKTVIFSAEDISAFKEKELYALKSFLMPLCNSIKVIGYIRSPIGFIQSALQQMIKDGAGRNIKQLVSLYPKYRSKFENFDKIFGNENVTLIKYDRSTLLNNDVVLDFCQRIGLAITEDNIIRDNESLSLEATALLYTYHTLGFGYGSFAEANQENKLLIQAITGIGNKKIQLSSDLTSEILEKNSEDIQWIESRLGCSLYEPVADSKESISSAHDLLAIASQYADELKNLLIPYLRNRSATPENVADLMHLLRQQLSHSEANKTLNTVKFFGSQIQRLKSENLQITDILNEIIFSLNYAGHEKAAENVHKLMITLAKNGVITLENQIQLALHIDGYNQGHLKGWILNKKFPLHKLSIEIHCNQRVIGQGVANLFRRDLADAGFGDGRCAFNIKLDKTINDFGDEITIRVMDYNKDMYKKTALIRGLH